MKSIGTNEKQMNREFDLCTVNNMFLKQLGYSYEELMQKTEGKITNIIYPADINYIYDSILKAEKNESKYEIKYRIQKSNGKYIWVFERGECVKTRKIDETIMQIAEHMIHPEDCDKFLQFFNLETIRACFTNNKDKLELEVRKLSLLCYGHRRT